MSHRLKIIKEWVDVNITAANQVFKESFDVDKHVSKIIGIAFTTNNDAMPYYRGSQKIAINGTSRNRTRDTPFFNSFIYSNVHNPRLFLNANLRCTVDF